MADETRLLGLEMRFIQREAPKAPDPAAEQRKRDRENGRQQAQAYASEALLQAVTIMRTSKDEKTQLNAAKYIMDRAWGPPKAPDEQEIALGNRDVFDVLASISAEITQHIQEKDVDATVQARGPENDAIAGEIEDGSGPEFGGDGFFAALAAAQGAVPAGEPPAVDADEVE